MTSLPISPVRRLAIVGRGRVGTALATAFRDAGIEVEGPLGRGASPTADVVLLCVPDAEIAQAAGAVNAAFVGHTSGATSLDHTDFGLHPLQTVVGPGTSFAGCGCAIAGKSAEARELAGALAQAIAMEPFLIDDGARAAYHASASIASNFVVTLEWMAERMAGAAGLRAEDARRMLVPLVRQTIDNWARLGPRDALTGPVKRGDELTVAKQRAAIETAAPDLVPAFDELVKATRMVASADTESVA
jgi:predicted short-subunit dehydrogenase-like oxidoreductase (DUF2520 family)